VRGAPQGEVPGVEAGSGGGASSGDTGAGRSGGGSGAATRICGAPQWGQKGMPSSTDAPHL
jgi:hypothetical protein